MRKTGRLWRVRVPLAELRQNDGVQVDLEGLIPPCGYIRAARIRLTDSTGVVRGGYVEIYLIEDRGDPPGAGLMLPTPIIHHSRHLVTQTADAWGVITDPAQDFMASPYVCPVGDGSGMLLLYTADETAWSDSAVSPPGELELDIEEWEEMSHPEELEVHVRRWPGGQWWDATSEAWVASRAGATPIEVEPDPETGLFGAAELITEAMRSASDRAYQVIARDPGSGKETHLTIDVPAGDVLDAVADLSFDDTAILDAIAGVPASTVSALLDEDLEAHAGSPSTVGELLRRSAAPYKRLVYSAWNAAGEPTMGLVLLYATEADRSADTAPWGLAVGRIEWASTHDSEMRILGLDWSSVL